MKFYVCILVFAFLFFNNDQTFAKLVTTANEIDAVILHISTLFEIVNVLLFELLCLFLHIPD